MEENRQSIVVGLRLDKSDDSLLNVTKSLAENWKVPIEAVHAIPPIFDYLSSGTSMEEVDFAHASKIRRMEEQRAAKLFEEIEEQAPFNMRTHLFCDHPADALLTVAAETHAKFIVCGLRIEQNRTLTSGFTTAFALAAEASVPVLVIPIGSEFSLENKLTALVADNLETEGRAALEGTLKLAQSLCVNKIHHVFVHDVRASELDEIAKNLKEAKHLGILPIETHFSKASYLEQIRTKTKEELLYRFQNSQGYEAYQGSYEAHVEFGSIARKIREIALHTKTQLLIFGRSKVSDQKRVTLGKMPYQVMVDSHYATLVVPEKIAIIAR